MNMHPALLKLARLACVLLVAVLLLAVPSARVSGGNSAPSELLQFTSAGHALGFAADGMYAATGSHALHVDFTDANSVQPQANSNASADGKAAPLGNITYAKLWDRISLTYAASPDGIYTTTFSLAPGANPADIRLRYNAPLTLNGDGTLGIAFATGIMTESAPLAWQEIKGQRVQVEAAFQVRGQEVTFALGAFDPQYPLTIDPTLTWNTFLGGSGSDNGTAIAVDGSGNVYVAGSSSQSWGSPLRPFSSNFDAFAAKLSPAGSLTWHTFLGGSGVDFGNAIAVDGSGNVYVAGYSSASWGCSPAACTVRPYTSSLDTFAAKLSSAGGLTWNTFLGGSGVDYGNGIAVDGSGNVYVTGYGDASWGSPVRPYTINSSDAFAAKLNSAGALTWNTFLGGGGDDWGTAIAVDGSGTVYVAGYSDATWGSPLRSFTASYDAFAAKLSSAGALTWNTFLGGSGVDYGYALAVSGSGDVYVAGYSDATWGSPVRSYTAGYDAFAARLDSTGSLSWNTFLGGSGWDFGYGIALDGSGNIYLAGYSNASWGSPERGFTASYDALAAKLDSSGGLTWNTFLGGSGVDNGYGIALDGSRNIYVAGSSDATWGSPVRSYTAFADTFAIKLAAPLVPPAAPVPLSPSGEISDPHPPYSWTSPTGAASYRLAVYSNDAHTYIIQVDVASSYCNGGVCTYHPATPLADGPFRFKVQARNASGLSPYGAFMNFTVITTPPAAPVLLSPVGTISDTHPPYRWNASTSASSYRLAVYSNDSLSYIIQTDVASSSCLGGICSYHDSTVLTAGSYRFKVLARNIAGQSPYSGWMNFTVTPPTPPAAPTLISPNGTISDTHPPYSWNASSGAASYRLAVYSNASLTYIILTDVASSYCSAGVCTFHPSTTLTPGTYRFKVLARSAVGSSPYSAWMNFTVTPPTPPAAPTLILPNGTISDTHPPYSWNASSGAASYRLAVYSYGLLSYVILMDVDGSFCTGGVCTYHPSTTLIAGDYRFKVLAKNEAGSSPYSAWMNFTVTP